MASSDVNINLKINAEKRGADDATTAINRFGAAAKKNASDAKGGFDNLQKSVGKVQGAFGTLRNVLTGFGIGAFVTAFTSGLSKIINSFESAEKTAAAFRDVQVKLAQENQIAKLAQDANDLANATERAARAENTRLEQIDQEVSARRRLDSAKREQSRLNELDALDPNAIDYNEKVAAINAKYARQGASADAANAVEDLTLQRQKLNASADQMDAAAAVKVKSTDTIKAQIAALKRQKGAADVAAVDLNENDKTNGLTAVGKTLAQLFTGDWGRMGEAKTAEGDQVRLAAAKESASLSQRIASLENTLKATLGEADDIRQNAAAVRARANGLSASIDAAQLEGANAVRVATSSETTAARALTAKHSAAAKEADTYASAASARELLAQEQADLKTRIAAEQAKKDAASLSVYNAQGNFDTARLSGGNQLSAYQNLQAAQGAAQNVNAAADSAINALTKTLQSVEQRLKAAQSYLENQSKSASSAWADAPAGT